MKYKGLILMTGLWLAGCNTQSGSLADLLSVYDSDNENTPVAENAEQSISVTTVETATPIQTQTQTPASTPVQTASVAYVEETPYDRYRHNVAMKAHDADFVTYEYRNIRVDELAGLAIRYCDEQGGKKAVLRSIVLHQNHNRVATFDCKNLAMEH